MPGSIGEYRVAETAEVLGSVVATPLLVWLRVIVGRIRRRKSDPDVVEGHRVIGLK